MKSRNRLMRPAGRLKHQTILCPRAFMKVFLNFWSDEMCCLMTYNSNLTYDFSWKWCKCCQNGVLKFGLLCKTEQKTVKKSPQKFASLGWFFWLLIRRRQSTQWTGSFDTKTTVFWGVFTIISTAPRKPITSRILHLQN